MFMISSIDKNRIYYYILKCLSSTNFQCSYNLVGFLDISNYARHKGGLGTAKPPIPMFNINVSKQSTLLDGIDVGPPKQRVCWRGLNRSVHEAMNSISNVKVRLKTRSGNVNIYD